MVNRCSASSSCCTRGQSRQQLLLRPFLSVLCSYPEEGEDILFHPVPTTHLLFPRSSYQSVPKFPQSPLRLAWSPKKGYICANSPHKRRFGSGNWVLSIRFQTSGGRTILSAITTSWNQLHRLNLLISLKQKQKTKRGFIFIKQRSAPGTVLSTLLTLT